MMQINLQKDFIFHKNDSINFYNSARHTIVTLRDMNQESEECASFCIETYNSMYEAIIYGSTKINTFRILYNELEKLYNGEQTEIHAKTTDGSLEITASMDMAGIIFWTFMLTEVGTRNCMEVKDCSDRTFLPELMKFLTTWIEEEI